MKLGGNVLDAVLVSLDYLVIGTMASREWKQSSFGTKIEKAIDFQKKGYGILIVSEEAWVQSLGSSS